MSDDRVKIITKDKCVSVALALCLGNVLWHAVVDQDWELCFCKSFMQAAAICILWFRAYSLEKALRETAS